MAGSSFGLNGVGERMDERPSPCGVASCETCEEAHQQGLARARFVARLGHTLRTPLNGIQGFSQILLQETAGPLNARQRAHVQRIEEAGERLLSLIDGLTELSRIHAGETEPQVSVTDVAQVVKRVLEGHRTEAEAKGVSISVRIDRQIPGVEADPDLLAGVVSRLVSNAIRHGQERGRVDIVGTLDGGGIEGSRTLTLAVVDDGPGIRADELPRLTRDTEPPRTSTAGSKRNGLGLVVTKRLVDLLGGRLRISSEPGRGTRAVVELPWVVLRTQPSGESAGHVSAPRDHAPDALASVTRE